MNGLRLAYIITAVSLVQSCEQSREMTSAEKKEVVSQVTNTLHDYYEDVKLSGLMAELDYLDSSSDFFWVPPGYSTALTYDSVVAILKMNAPGLKSIDNSFDTLSVRALSQELAIYTGRLRSVVVDSAGTTNSFSLMETGILIKRKNGWKLLGGQTSLQNN